MNISSADRPRVCNCRCGEHCSSQDHSSHSNAYHMTSRHMDSCYNNACKAWQQWSYLCPRSESAFADAYQYQPEHKSTTGMYYYHTVWTALRWCCKDHVERLGNSSLEFAAVFFNEEIEGMSLQLESFLHLMPSNRPCSTQDPNTHDFQSSMR